MHLPCRLELLGYCKLLLEHVVFKAFFWAKVLRMLQGLALTNFARDRFGS